MAEGWMTLIAVAFVVAVASLLGWVGWACFLRPAAVSALEMAVPAGVQNRPAGRWWDRFLNRGKDAVERATQSKGEVGQSAAAEASKWRLSPKVRRYVALVAPVGGVVLTILVVLSQRDGVSLDPVAAREHRYQAAVGAVLQEQKLVPPAVLPPTVFQNLDDKSLSLEQADRDWNKLDPVFAQLVLRVMERLRTKGIQMVLLEGYRSPERQEALASREVKVTAARGGQSKHQYGMAVDLAPFRDGRLVISESDPWAAQVYEIYGQEAEAVGLVWGGRWSFRDLVHIEAPGTIADNIRAAAPDRRR